MNSTLQKIFRVSALLIPFAYASAKAAEEPRLQVASFGLSERVLFMPRLDDPSYSGMIHWYPEYHLSSNWSAVGWLGAAQLKGVEGTFWGYNALVGVAYQGLHPHWVPEALIGGEHWDSSSRGTAFTTALNLHYRTWFDGEYSRFIDSVWIGWHTIHAKDYANVASLGVRFSFPPVRPLTASAVPEQTPDQNAALANRTETIYFPRSVSILSPDSDPVLDRAAAQLKNNPGSTAELHGYADIFGDDAVNDRITRARAENVKAALVQRGIAAERLTAIGHGKRQTTETARIKEVQAKNRRVAIVIK